MLPFVISLERGKNSDTMGKGLLSSGNINSDFRIKFFFFPLLSPLSRKIPFFIEISLKKKKNVSVRAFIHFKEGNCVTWYEISYEIQRNWQRTFENRFTKIQNFRSLRFINYIILLTYYWRNEINSISLKTYTYNDINHNINLQSRITKIIPIKLRNEVWNKNLYSIPQRVNESY